MVKVTYSDKGQMVEREFKTEEEGKKFKMDLKKRGIKGAKWEW